MICRSKVQNGVIPLPPGVDLPDGAEVQITLPDRSAAPSFAERYSKFVGVETNLPADLADNHDHYAHGRPKR